MMKPVWLSLLWEEIHLSSGGKVFHDKPCCHVIIKLGSVYWLFIAIFSVSGSQEPVTKQFCFYLSRFWWVSCLFQNIYFHRASESYSASLFCIPMLICLSRWALACHLVLFFPCISWAANLSLSSVLRAWCDSFLQKTWAVRKTEILLQVPCRFPHSHVRPRLRCCLRTWIKETSCWERWNTQRLDVWCVIWNSLSLSLCLYIYIYAYIFI